MLPVLELFLILIPALFYSGQQGVTPVVEKKFDYLEVLEKTTLLTFSLQLLPQ